MTALIAERNTQRYGTTVIPDFLPFGVAAGANCWQGGLAALNAAGYVQPPQTAGSLFCVGVNYVDALNSAGAAGAQTSRVLQGVFPFAQGTGADAMTIANVGQNVWAIDDQTVGLTNGFAISGAVRAFAGRLVYVDGSGIAWVLVGLTSATNDLPLLNTPVLVHTARGAIPSALPAYTAAGGTLTANANGALAAQDGLTIAVGDVLFLPIGVAASVNDEGPYVVTSLGSAGSKWTMTRPSDWATATPIQNGAIYEIREGTLFGGTTWKAFCTGANVVDANAPNFYPREVSQSVTLATGFVTKTNVPIRSTTATGFVFTPTNFNGAGSTVSYRTGAYASGGAATVAGGIGTGSVSITALVAAGTFNTSDVGTGLLTIINW